MKKILLDTNAFVALFRGDKGVLDYINHADRVYASVIAIGELLAGFRGGTHYRRNCNMLDRFLSKPAVDVIPVTRDTSDCFGRLKDTLKKNGTPIPINDVWLGAHGLEYGAIIVTFDRHFTHVPGLRLWDR